MAVHAGEAWRALERDAGETLLYRTGGLDIDRSGSVELESIAATLKEARRPHELLSGPAASKRFPAFRLSARQMALYQPDAGILPASRCLSIMQRQAFIRGAEVRAGERVVGLNSEERPVKNFSTGS